MSDQQPLRIQPLQISPAPPSTWTTDSEQRRKLSRRAQLLAATSVTYNLVDAAGSVALVGFELDSVSRCPAG